MRMIMNEIKLYNTLTKKVETFEPNEPGKVKMYTVWSDSVTPFCTYR